MSAGLARPAPRAKRIEISAMFRFRQRSVLPGSGLTLGHTLLDRGLLDLTRGHRTARTGAEDD